MIFKEKKTPATDEMDEWKESNQTFITNKVRIKHRGGGVK